MNETNDQQPDEQSTPEAPAQPGQVSDDVSLAMDGNVDGERGESTESPDVTGDVSEAFESAPDEESAANESSAAEVSAPARARGDRDQDPKYELRQLMELAVKYPEIGPPLAELAFKIGFGDIGQRIVRMGLDDDETTGVEFYAVAVDVARREGRFEDVFSQVEDALKTFAATTDDAVTEDEANRLLHLVRSGFAVLLFDLEDVNAKPEWTKSLAEQLPRLESRFAEDPFFFSLLAQARWFADKEASEATWERAIELAGDDFAWNARGTWYKDAVRDFTQAEETYRRGLKAYPESALLLHNLAQLLTDEADKRGDEDADQARTWLREADELVRKSLRQQTRRGLRRYIHNTKDRIRKLQAALPVEQHEPPAIGEAVRGRVVALAQYGAFVTIAGGYKGLLHNTEIAHERVNNPESFFKIGDKIQVKVLTIDPQPDGTTRIGFSRKALLPAPEKPAATEQASPAAGAKGEDGQQQKTQRRNDGPRNDGRQPRGDRDQRGKGGGKGRGKGGGGGKKGGGGQAPKQHRDNPRGNDGIGTLGEMLLAKLEEAKGNSDE